MELRRDLQLGILTLLAVQVLSSFGAIGLLSRMSPAIERILEENVYSIQAAEEMMVVLALGRGGSREPELEERLRKWLGEARRNITETDETRAIETVERQWSAALEGDSGALATTVEALQAIVSINRSAMRRADGEAKRMGTAGAWASALAAMAGFSISLVVIRRLRARILRPLLELYQTLEAWRRGNRFRRCRMVEAPAEITRVLKAVNALLDERQEGRDQGDASSRNEARGTALYLLDQRREPAFVVDGEGEIRMANEAGMELLGGEDAGEVRARLRRAPKGEAAGEMRAARIERANLWLCEISPWRP